LFTSNSDEAANSDRDLAQRSYERLSRSLNRSSPVAEPMSIAE